MASLLPSTYPQVSSQRGLELELGLEQELELARVLAMPWSLSWPAQLWCSAQEKVKEPALPDTAKALPHRAKVLAAPRVRRRRNAAMGQALALEARSMPD